MEWYSGSIPEAIQLAKSRKVLFVVYISGKLDDMSQEMDKSWNSTSVVEASEKTGVIAIRIEADSDTCAQFSAIFPVVVVPATYFIGNDGMPIDVIGGAKSDSELADIIQNISNMHSYKMQSSGILSSSPDALGSVEAKPDQYRSSAASGEVGTAAADSTVSIEERSRRAQELLNEKRVQKAEKEKEEQKEKEKERRELGKNVAKLKQWKDEQEAKEAMEKIKKDKEADKLAKERIKEQIARDREERKKRYQQEKSDQHQAKEDARIAKLKAEQEARDKQIAERSSKACIQFRMADGSFITEQFAATDSLAFAQQFVVNSLHRGPETFRMCLAYPRREFSANDMSQSLADLGLAPSAAIMILPPARGSTVVTPTGNQGLFAMILAPFFAIWNFVYSFIFGRGRSSTAPTHTSQPRAQSKEPGPSNPRKRSAASGSRREGNIHRLTRDDDDDDMNTWNGNSTQQM